MRKLVKKDSNGRLMEVDRKAMQREALVLQCLIDEAPEAEKAKLKYAEWLQPVIDAALNGTIQIPYPGEPYNFRLMVEGLLPELPEHILEPYALFVNRITGSPSASSCSRFEPGGYVHGACEEVIDGEKYEWVIFED